MAKIGPAVAEIWALMVLAARLGAAHLDRMHQQPDLALPLPPNMIPTKFNRNRLRTVDLYSKQIDTHTDRQIELYKVDIYEIGKRNLHDHANTFSVR